MLEIQKAAERPSLDAFDECDAIWIWHRNASIQMQTSKPRDPVRRPRASFCQEKASASAFGLTITNGAKAPSNRNSGGEEHEEAMSSEG
jgi:hypothetical protein